MKPLNEFTYLLHEREVEVHLEQDHPVIKVNLYGEQLQEGPCKSVYFKLLVCSKHRLEEYEKILRNILRKYSAKTLAFSYEVLSQMPSKRDTAFLTLEPKN